MTKFREGFMMKSPLPAHSKLKKQLDILKNNPEKAAKMGLSSDRGDGKDFEAISRLEKKIKEEKAKHSSKRREIDSAQIREDEDAAKGSAIEMTQVQPIDASAYFVAPDQMDYSDMIKAAGKMGAQKSKRAKELDDLEASGMTRGEARKQRRENKKK